MDLTTIYEKKTLVWNIENDAMCIDTEKGKLILNSTVKIVWELIDGARSLQEIIAIMIERYGEENEKDYIASVVKESAVLLLDNGVIKTVDENLFGGWLQYE